MNKKGFTLVELLAVITILSLLALLTSVGVMKLIKDAKNDLSSAQINLIKSAAEQWGTENIAMLPDEGECGYLSLKNLKEYGLFNSSIKDSKTGQEISDDLIIKITSTLNEYGNQVITYDVDPESVVGCQEIY